MQEIVSFNNPKKIKAIFVCVINKQQKIAIGTKNILHYCFLNFLIIRLVVFMYVCMAHFFDLLHLFQYSQYPVNDKKAYNSNS